MYHYLLPSSRHHREMSQPEREKKVLLSADHHTFFFNVYWENFVLHKGKNPHLMICSILITNLVSSVLICKEILDVDQLPCCFGHLSRKSDTHQFCFQESKTRKYSALKTQFAPLCGRDERSRKQQDAISWEKMCTNRGFYTAVRRYETSLRVSSEIFFNTRGEISYLQEAM